MIDSGKKEGKKGRLTPGKDLSDIVGRVPLTAHLSKSQRYLKPKLSPLEHLPPADFQI